MIAVERYRTGLISALCIAFASFHLYTGMFGVFTVAVQTGVHLAFILVLILLVRPTNAPCAGLVGRVAALTYDSLVAACAAGAMNICNQAASNSLRH